MPEQNTNLGGNPSGVLPIGGLLSGVVDGSNTRNINRTILRKSMNTTSNNNGNTPFRNNLNTSTNNKHVYQGSDYTRYKKLVSINKTYNNLKY